MARYVPEGTVEVWLVLTIADAAAPTSTELNAGTALEGQMIGDLVLPFEGSTADASDASSRFNKTAPGDFGGAPGSFTIHKEKALGDDGVFTALARDVEGFIAIAVRGLALAGTWAIGDEVDVWPITVLSREIQYARNTTLRAGIQVAITDVPDLDFILVA